MQDGQNLFAGKPSRDDDSWRMAEAADAAIAAGEVDPLLIAGIAHAGEARLAEYTPTNDWKLGGGQADQYGLFLIEELLPFIAAHYRVRPGAPNTGLGGSSMGALASLYLGLKYAETFGKLAIFSPSVWWNHRAILSLVSEAAPKLHSRPSIWLDVGEGEGPQAVNDCDLLDRRLRAKGWRSGPSLSGPSLSGSSRFGPSRSGHDLQYQRFPSATHDEASWAQRVRPMLRYLFGAR